MRTTVPTSCRPISASACSPPRSGWGTPGQIRWVGPDLGSSNCEILGEELGYSDEELERLAERGVIAPIQDSE